MSRCLTAFLVLLTLSCATQRVQTGLTVDGRPQVRLWRVNLEDGSRSTQVWARNESKVDVVLLELRLSDCRNLFQRCGAYEVNLPLAPGEEARVAQFESSGAGQFASFGFASRWRTVGQGAATPLVESVPGVALVPPRPPPATAPVVVRGAAGREVVTPVPLAEFVPLVEPTEDEASCEPPLEVRGGSGEVIYRMRFGPLREIRAARMVTVSVNAEGQVIRFSDTRGDLRVLPPGMVADRPIADPGPRTTINIDLQNQMAVVMNQPPDGPTARHLIQDDGLLDADNLGRPVVAIERVMRECGPK